MYYSLSLTQAFNLKEIDNHVHFYNHIVVIYDDFNNIKKKNHDMRSISSSGYHYFFNYQHIYFDGLSNIICRFIRNVF